jgi:hypothetical protein
LVRIVRTAIKVIILAISLSLTLVSAIGTISTLHILSNPNNVFIGTPVINLNTPPESVSIPFTFNNTGLYDFTDVIVSVKLTAYNTSNIAESYVIINNVFINTTILANTKYDGGIFINDGNITIPIEMQTYPTNWNASIAITLTSLYTLNLISFRVDILYNVTLILI